jgi:predicted secreted Zn-dependent protease
VTVTNTMEPSLSWVVAGKATAQVLRHEQGHFDLNEVYRRKLEVNLACLQAQSATKEGAIDALNATLHQKASEILGQLQAAQARYDAEAGYGSNPTGQAQWEALIAAWLLTPSAAP